MRITPLLLLLACLLGASQAATADNDNSNDWIKQTIYGMDCAPCAHAVEKSLGRLTGVESVEVRLNDGIAVLNLTPEADPDIGEIREIARRNGFTPRGTELRIRGRMTKTEAEHRLTAGNQTFTLLPGESVTAEQLEGLTGEAVVVRGRMTESDSGRIHLDTLNRIE